MKLVLPGFPGSLLLLVSLKPKWVLPALRSGVCIPLNESYYGCQHLSAENKKRGGKKKIEMNACGALAAASVRVLGCYLGLKYIQGGTQGSCSRAGGGGGNSAKRNSGADKCLKRWQNVICWHLPTEGPRCFKHDGAAFTTSDSCQREGEKWLNTVFSKGHRPLFQRPAGAAREARIIQLFLPTESHL